MSNVDTQHTLMSKMKGFDLNGIVGWPIQRRPSLGERDSPDAHSYLVLIQQSIGAHPEAQYWAAEMTVSSINRTLGYVLLYN